MRGDFIGAWPEAWEAIWRPLTETGEVPADVYCDLYRELVKAFAVRPSIEVLADIIDDQQQSRQALIDSRTAQFSSEKALVRFFESVHDVLDDLQGQELTERYFILLGAFIEKYNLGYELLYPCNLSPTLPGMFADLTGALKKLTGTNAHLAALHRAHDESVHDLRHGATEDRIKTCISKQFMMLEAIAACTDGVTAKTLGDMCGQVQSWPHATIRESLKKLYGFASDYPGIRHAGNPDGKLREVGVHDLAALSIVLTGYAVYLAPDLDIKLASFLTD